MFEIFDIGLLHPPQHAVPFVCRLSSCTDMFTEKHCNDSVKTIPRDLNFVSGRADSLVSDMMALAFDD